MYFYLQKYGQIVGLNQLKNLVIVKQSFYADSDSFLKQIHFRQQIFILTNATPPLPWEVVFTYYEYVRYRL